ncbi:S-layer homology domain-containing protein [Paenibacillus sp. L3-i20]|uniref:S-layer homology domain-containing protein n=1 Tax=Paenibacillus sp. L3-i20 TaxID=2905833 RepID=UPI001EDEB4E6|nr:S-layer homology domain-containing protein [Paenibacillus sp. L3-i20]GKU78602.1 hypothetical protein L3i20_v229990 [Paenibacillus sp. L3-i20]
MSEVIRRCHGAMSVRFKLWIALITLLLILSFFFIPILAKASSHQDIENHWAKSYIEWALNENLVRGYEDGTFQPDKSVSEAEFLALFMRAYNVANLSQEGFGNEWHKPYYTYAQTMGWPIIFNNERGSFSRGQVALLIASSVNGKHFVQNTAIQWLLDQGISKGRSSATVKGFAANDKVTRAEALTFIYMLKRHTASLSTTKIMEEKTSLHSIAINDHVNKLLFILGKPLRIDPSEYDFKWYVYNLGKEDYKKYALFGVLDNKIVALYANTPSNWFSSDGIKLNQSLADTKKKLIGEILTKTDHTYYAFSKSGIRYTLFIDAHANDLVIGMLQQVDGLKRHEFSTMQDEHRVALEKQLFELVNSERAIRGINLLQWDTTANIAAKAHSADMMKNNFFNHKNLKKQTPFDRFRAGGITFRIASENIAAGFENSIFTHYNLLNSTTGHRATILNDELQRLGTGVAFGGRYKVYYTQDFYTPLDDTN